MKKCICSILILVFVLCACQFNIGGNIQETASPETTSAQQTTAAPQQTVYPSVNSEIISPADFPKIDGSLATLPLATALFQKFTGSNEQTAEENVVFTNTNPSYYELQDGNADILLVYEAADKTKEETKNAGFEITPIGKDALVFIVNESNPVESLTTQQLIDIYSGKITNWKEVGGEDLEIIAFQRPESSGSQTMIEKLLMKETKMIKPSTEVIMKEMGDIIEKISEYNNSGNALGYSVYYYAKNMFVVEGLKFIKVDNVQPDNETIKTNKYPFINEFFAVLSPKSSDNARRLKDYLISDEGQKFIEENGYVPCR